MTRLTLLPKNYACAKRQNQQFFYREALSFKCSVTGVCKQIRLAVAFGRIRVIFLVSPEKCLV